MTGGIHGTTMDLSPTEVTPMNIEVKGNLARLLATENLIVEHRSVETACFDINNRILTLPIWNTSAEVYDMLVGHEVGHALYTPPDYVSECKKGSLPQSYLNVVEDARIEKMMKRKFPGLARSFYSAYVELYKKDFFGIGERSFDTYTLIDRINLYFKIGIHASAIIPFNEEEKQLVEIVEKTESFEDVVEAVKKILQYTKEKESEKLANASEGASEENQQPSQGSQGNSDYESSTEYSDEYDEGSDVNGNGSPSESKSSSEDDGEDEETPGESTNSASTYGNNDKVTPESETDKAFNNAQRNLVAKGGTDPIYLEVPDMNLDTIVVDNKTIHDELKTHWSGVNAKAVTNCEKKYLEFRKESQREVNYLVKEFEMRKSADRYARSSVAKTGVLNTSKLHTYKWNEDLFKKVSVVPDGKNHGLIFILDWSGSMGSVLEDTAKQLFNLLWFCKKVQIPFDVYLFTNDYGYYKQYDHYNNGVVLSEHVKNVPNTFYIAKTFNLLNIISSESKTVDLEVQLKNFWKLVYSQGHRTSMSAPSGYYLSGTPLDESIITLHKLIPDFQKRTRCQKTNVIILTDGEAQSISRIVSRSALSTRIGTNSISRNCVLRNRKNGRVYEHFDDYCSMKNTSIFIQSVKDAFPDVNIIGIRLASGTDVYRIYESFQSVMEQPYEYFQRIWRKEHSLEFKNVGYESLYIISNNSLSSTKDYMNKVTDESSSSDLKNAFSKTLKSKSVNKKMLSSFAKLIS